MIMFYLLKNLHKLNQSVSMGKDIKLIGKRGFIG